MKLFFISSNQFSHDNLSQPLFLLRKCENHTLWLESAAIYNLCQTIASNLHKLQVPSRQPVQFAAHLLSCPERLITNFIGEPQIPL